MSRILCSRRAFAGIVIVGLVAAACIAPALAVFPHQSTTLPGPPLNGYLPEGMAQLDQHAQPNGPGRLAVEVANLALPNGASLNVMLDRRPMGVIVVHGGTGTLSAPVGFQVGRLSSLVVTYGNQTVATGTTPWQVPWPTTP